MSSNFYEPQRISLRESASEVTFVEKKLVEIANTVALYYWHTQLGFLQVKSAVSIRLSGHHLLRPYVWLKVSTSITMTISTFGWSLLVFHV